MDIKPNEWINANTIHSNFKKSIKPPVDVEVSKIVGKQVLAQDPRLIALIVKWKQKQHKAEDDFTPDNNLNNQEFIKELKEIFV